MRRDTELVHFEAAPGDGNAPAVTPIHQTATFAQPDAVSFGPYDYTRSANPTRTVLEKQLARLEGGAGACAYASGMAALAAALRLARSGERVLAGADLYGGTVRLLERLKSDVRVDYVDATDPVLVERELARGARMLLIETPSNPLQEIADVARLAELAHDAGALLAVDNTMLSPYLQNPLEDGADLALHSGTKHLGGHGDVTAGAVVARDAGLAQELHAAQNAEGTALGPMDSWLLLRGMKTLGLRIEREQASAVTIAEWLTRQPAVTRVHYAGLPEHPGHELHCRQARGPGSVVSFETGDLALSRAVVENTRLFRIAVSFGSVASSISLPRAMSHASIPPDRREVRPLPEDLVRISVGIEDPRDLLEDLAAAFASGQLDRRDEVVRLHAEEGAVQVRQ